MSRLVAATCSLLLVVVGLPVPAGPAGAAPAQAHLSAIRPVALAPAVGPVRPIRIVQLGDSYSAGNGAGGYYGPKGCYRSKHSWGERYARWLGNQGYSVTFINRACSGGVVSDISGHRVFTNETVRALVSPFATTTDESVRTALEAACVTDPLEESAKINEPIVITRVGPSAIATATCDRTLEPQWNAVNKDTDLVLLTIGGNDVEFATIVEQCFAPGFRDPGDCREAINFAKDHLPDLQTDIEKMLVGLRTERNLRDDARVAMLTYPEVRPDEARAALAVIEDVPAWPFPVRRVGVDRDLDSAITDHRSPPAG